MKKNFKKMNFLDNFFESFHANFQTFENVYILIIRRKKKELIITSK